MFGLFLQKIKKGITITNAFPKIQNKSGIKPNKIWVDKGSEFYNKSLNSQLQNNNTEMHSTHSTGKSAVAEKIQIGLTKLLELFMKKRKTNENVFTIEKEVKRKGNGLYGNGNGKVYSFNSWIDKKYIFT